jgi:glycosyltransferase involved in cell wall biosynthesis
VVDRPAAGIVVAERTPAALAAAIGRLLSAPPEQDAVRAAAERFTWEKNSRALFDHLSELKR